MKYADRESFSWCFSRAGRVRVEDERGGNEIFDECIVAAHAPDALEMRGEYATSNEKKILGAFQYAYRYALLAHSILPHPLVGSPLTSRKQNLQVICAWRECTEHVLTNEFFLNPPWQ